MTVPRYMDWVAVLREHWVRYDQRFPKGTVVWVKGVPMRDFIERPAKMFPIFEKSGWTVSLESHRYGPTALRVPNALLAWDVEEQL